MKFGIIVRLIPRTRVQLFIPGWRLRWSSDPLYWSWYVTLIIAQVVSITSLQSPPLSFAKIVQRMVFSKALAFLLLSNAAILSHAAVQKLSASSLPPSFKWGVASSAYQSEGGYTNSNWDIYNANPLATQDPYGTSVDFRHRYRSDIALAQVRTHLMYDM